jgi:hypothetical protein
MPDRNGATLDRRRVGRPAGEGERRGGPPSPLRKKRRRTLPAIQPFTWLMALLVGGVIGFVLLGLADAAVYGRGFYGSWGRRKALLFFLVLVAVWAVGILAYYVVSSL